MKIRENIILQFTLITFIVVGAVASSLAFLLANSMTDRAIRHHIDFYPRLTTNLIEDETELYKMFKADLMSDVSREIYNKFNEFLNFGTIFRIKVWSLDGTILWSNEPKIIGKKFQDNEDLLVAKKGVVQYEVKTPHKEEHAYEKNANKILEIYIPVRLGNEVVGVVEVYEAADKLFRNIRRDISIIWLLVGIAGLSIYLLLFVIFLKAHKRQNRVNKQLLDTQQVVINSLVYQAEIRDVETGRHLERTTEYVRILAEDMKSTPPKYKVRESDKNYLTDEYINDLANSAPLHDIGKVGIPDAILCKPGKLTPEEFEVMKKHCEHGAEVLKKAEEKLSFRSFLAIGVQLALSHHERWDGQGYPYGLKGEEIPLSARIMAIADVYDTLRSERCYKKSFSHEKSRKIISAGKGTQFDPIIIDAFLRKENEFEKISVGLAD